MMLRVNNISFAYHTTSILKHISFEVSKGENLAIIGESGSGKSTLLKLLYGEYDLAEGEIWWYNKQILGPSSHLVVGYDFVKSVAQEFDLMPFTTVAENIGKFLSRFYPNEKEKRTKVLIDLVELEAYANTKVKYLSGGQKQRVALARALAKAPEILLLDEPFSHIDNFKRQSLRRNIFEYLKAENITCLVATHDKNDVLGFADQIVVLHNKSILRKDTPQRIYTSPEHGLVASFFDEYSEINGTIFYPHQLNIVETSKYKAIVRQSYFNATNWLIEAKYNATPIFLYHRTQLPKGEIISFEIDKNPSSILF